MLLGEACRCGTAAVFKVLSDNGPPNSWIVEPLPDMTVPACQGLFIVRAYLVKERGHREACFVDLIMPERIVDDVYFVDEMGIERQPYYKCLAAADVVPAVGIEDYGNYELFYPKRDPEVGIKVLRDALAVAKNKGPMAEDLGYILRDEGRPHEAIDAFSIAIAVGPSSDYIYSERGLLYQQIGDPEKARRDLSRGPPVDS